MKNPLPPFVFITITLLGSPLVLAQDIIVDDTDRVNVTTPNVWNVVRSTAATAGNIQGPTFRVDSLPGENTAAKPLKTLVYRPTIAVTGSYDVSVWVPASATAASNASVHVAHAGGLASIRVNQRSFGSRWVRLGTFPLAKGRTTTVTFSNADSDGPVAADAVKFSRVLPVPSGLRPGREIIIDNTDRINVTKTGEWFEGAAASSLYGGSEWVDSAPGETGPKTAKSVTFRPNLPAADLYDVYLWHSASAAHAAAVPIVITTAESTVGVTLDQRRNGGQWVYLGQFPFAAGRTGAVSVGNTGTTGLVSADAVRFLRAPSAADVATMQAGLAAWRKPDMNGISCAQCHGPAGYDIAVFNFTAADLRRAAAPHLPPADADAIFAMLQELRATYPPHGGLKDVRSFRPMQPANGVMSGSDTETSIQQDAAFGRYLAANFRLGGPRVTTLADAKLVQQELTTLDATKIPYGIRLPLWSSSLSRQGPGEHQGGSINEWIPPIGIQVKPAYEAQWLALNDAYIASPTTENLLALLRVIPDGHIFEDEEDPNRRGPIATPWFTFDHHNLRDGTAKGWAHIALAQFKSNLLFQHDQLQRALGQPAILDQQDGNRLFGRAKATRFDYEPSNFMWTVGESTNFHYRFGFINANPPDPGALEFKTSAMPLRNAETSSDWIDRLASDDRSAATAHMALPWFFLGWVYDNTIQNSGDPTRGEYFDASWRPQDYYEGDHLLVFHKAFTALVVGFKRQYLPDPYDPGYIPRWFPFSRLSVAGVLDRVNVPGYPEARAAAARLASNGARAMLLLYLERIKSDQAVYSLDRQAFDTEWMITYRVKPAYDMLRQMDPEWAAADAALYAEITATMRSLPLR